MAPTTSKKRKARDLRKKGENKRLKTDAERAEEAVVSNKLFGNADIASIIFSFLEVRELLQFVSSSKEYSSRLSYTHVVRSALMSGGRARSSMERIAPLIQKQTIWIPTQKRLLRLMCGKRCERCNTHKVNLVSDSFGVFYCFENCLTGASKKIGHNMKWSPYLNAPRVATRRYSSNSYIFAGTVKDKANEERIGPLVTKKRMEIMMGDKAKRNLSPTEKVKSFLESCDNEQPHAVAAVKEIMEAMQETKEAANERQKTKDAKKEEGRKNFANARKTKADKLISDAINIVGDDASWREYLNEDQRWWQQKKHYYHFKNTTVEHFLGQALHAASKVTKKKLQEICGQINEQFDAQAKMDAVVKDLCDHVAHEKSKRLMKRRWSPKECRYIFSDPLMRGALGPALTDHRKLPTEEKLFELEEHLREVCMRREIADQLLEKLVVLLEGFRFKQDVVDHWWNVCSHSYRFKLGYVNDILEKALEIPSKVSDEDLVELAEKLKPALEKKAKAHGNIDYLLSLHDDTAPWKDKVAKCWRWDNRSSEYKFNGREDIVRLLKEGLGGEPDGVTEDDLKELARKLQEADEKRARIDELTVQLMELVEPTPWSLQALGWYGQWRDYEPEIRFPKFLTKILQEKVYAKPFTVTQETVQEIFELLRDKYENEPSAEE